MAQEQSHGCKFELQTGLISLRQSPYERVYMTVVEVNGGDSFPFGPAGKSSCNGSLLAKGSFRVTSLAKVLKEWFDLIIKQGLRPAGAGCGHERSISLWWHRCQSGEAIRLCRVRNRQKPGGLRQNWGHTA
jgi:hypothetical protein